MFEGTVEFEEDTVAVVDNVSGVWGLVDALGLDAGVD